MREIAPLLRERHVFAESANFALFDFWRDDGKVDENVFAWSNRAGDQRALAVYHNKYASTSGTLHHSAARGDKASGQLITVSIHEALDLPREGNDVLACQDNASGLHYLRRASEIRDRGLHFHLGAYQYHVFQNWRAMHATADYPWDALCSDLNGTGVWSLDDAMAKFKLRPVHEALRAALRADVLRCYSDLIEAEAPGAGHTRAAEAPCSREDTLAALEKSGEAFFRAALAALAIEVHPAVEAEISRATEIAHGNGSKQAPRAVETSANLPSDRARLARDRYHALLRAAARLPELESHFAHTWPPEARMVLPSYSPQTTAVTLWAPVLAWCLLDSLIEQLPRTGTGGEAFDQLYLRTALAEAFHPLGIEGEAAYRAAARVRVVLTQQHGEDSSAARLIWDNPDTIWLTGLHEAQGHRYFNKEAHEQMVWWLLLPRLMDIAEQDAKAISGAARGPLRSLESAAQRAIANAQSAGYRLDEMERMPGVSGSGTKEAVPGSMEIAAGKAPAGTLEGAGTAKRNKDL